MLRGTHTNAMHDRSRLIYAQNVICYFSLNFVQLMEFGEIDLNDRLQRGNNKVHELHKHKMVEKQVLEIYRKLAALSEGR